MGKGVQMVTCEVKRAILEKINLRRVSKAKPATDNGLHRPTWGLLKLNPAYPTQAYL